jgi:hypothetical protein
MIVPAEEEEDGRHHEINHPPEVVTKEVDHRRLKMNVIWKDQMPNEQELVAHHLRLLPEDLEELTVRNHHHRHHHQADRDHVKIEGRLDVLMVIVFSKLLNFIINFESIFL